MAASSCQSSSARLSPLSQEGPSALGSKSFLLPRVQRASSDAASIAPPINNSSELTVLVEDHPSQVPNSDIRSVREGRRARKPLSRDVGAHRNAFAKHREDFGARGDRELIHARHVRNSSARGAAVRNLLVWKTVTGEVKLRTAGCPLDQAEPYGDCPGPLRNLGAMAPRQDYRSRLARHRAVL